MCFAIITLPSAYVSSKSSMSGSGQGRSAVLSSVTQALIVCCSAPQLSSTANMASLRLSMSFSPVAPDAYSATVPTLVSNSCPVIPKNIFCSQIASPIFSLIVSHFAAISSRACWALSEAVPYAFFIEPSASSPTCLERSINS